MLRAGRRTSLWLWSSPSQKPLLSTSLDSPTNRFCIRSTSDGRSARTATIRAAPFRRPGHGHEPSFASPPVEHDEHRPIAVALRGEETSLTGVCLLTQDSQPVSPTETMQLTVVAGNVDNDQQEWLLFLLASVADDFQGVRFPANSMPRGRVRAARMSRSVPPVNARDEDGMCRWDTLFFKRLGRRCPHNTWAAINQPPTSAQDASAAVVGNCGACLGRRRSLKRKAPSHRAWRACAGGSWAAGIRGWQITSRE